MQRYTGAVLAVSFAVLLASPRALRAQTTGGTAPASPSTGQASHSPAADNPFPEAESEAAEKQANAADRSAADGPAPDTDADGSSSSRSRLKGIDVLGDNDPHASNGAGGVVQNPELAKEDVRVGQLYLSNGNYPGAYARFKEATEVGPGNADAVFFLAEAARKTAHLDEAAANYKLYLEAEPKGKRAKEAKKALVELAGK